MSALRVTHINSSSGGHHFGHQPNTVSCRLLLYENDKFVVVSCRLLLYEDNKIVVVVDLLLHEPWFYCTKDLLTGFALKSAIKDGRQPL